MPKDIVVQKLTDEAFRPFGRIIEGTFPTASDDLERLLASNNGERVSLPNSCVIDTDDLGSAILVEIIEPRIDLYLRKIEAHLWGEEVVWCETCDCIVFVGPCLTDWQAPLESFFDEMSAFFLPRRRRLAIRRKVLHYVPLLKVPGLLRFLKAAEIELHGTFTRKKEIPTKLQPRVIVPSEFGIW